MMAVVSSLWDVKHFVHVRIRLDGVEQRRNGGAQHRQTAGDHPRSEHSATTGSMDDGPSIHCSPPRSAPSARGRGLRNVLELRARKLTRASRYHYCAIGENTRLLHKNVCDFNCHKIIKYIII